MATLGLGMPVAGFLAAHLGDAFSYGLETVHALEWLDRPQEQFGVRTER